MSLAIHSPGNFANPSVSKPSVKALTISGIPMYVYAVSMASLFVILGILWDISWHKTIGRDKLLSPPHNLIYLGAVFGGLFSGIQVLWNTFKADAGAKSGLVKVWGIFYSSLGALFCIWGAIAMLTSAPFDDWWHNTYGLDVQILSPPHTVLALGMMFLQFGACVGVSKYLNQTEKGSREKQTIILRILYLVAAASLLAMVCTILSEYLDTRNQRTGIFYMVASASALLFLTTLARPLGLRWGNTWIACGYFLILAVTNWVLQIFKAEPLLGPIQHHVTHYQPLMFPVLLFIPALAMDVVMQNVKRNDWIKSVCLSLAFVALLALVQYPFSGFLLESPSARNWFFGSHSWYYGANPGWEYRFKFAPWELQSWGSLLKQLGIAFVIGVLAARLGLRWGKWLGMVRR
jgi:hypothetical protein